MVGIFNPLSESVLPTRTVNRRLCRIYDTQTTTNVGQSYIQERVSTPETKPILISSSVPPVFPSEQEQLFREVLTLFNEKHVPYVVSGAFALQKHTGIWRNTKDLDLFLAPEDVPRAMQALKDHGFETEVR